MAQKYRPLFRLDAGGMAEVYVAEAEALAGFKKRVAIKRILPGLLKDERFVRMFLDEARLSLRLNHANVVSVFDIGKSENTYFIVMEYIEGTTLKKLMEHAAGQGRRLPTALVIWTLNEILKGLEYAHNLADQDGKNLGIVHRDISPPNILISWNGEVKLTDFGLAKATTQLESTDPGVVKGKFSYLSPEAAHGVAVDGRTDIFAVGILGYEMLTGRRLFLGETDYQTVELVRAADIPSIRQQNPDVTPELEQVMRRALARDLNQRYATAADFADDLLHVLFSQRMKFSARDLSGVLAEIRATKPRPEQQVQMSVGTNMILDLLKDEMVNFKSIDETSDDEIITGAQPLSFGDDNDDYDPSQPLSFDDMVPGPSEAPGAAPLDLGDGGDPLVADSSPPPSTQGPRGGQAASPLPDEPLPQSGPPVIPPPSTLQQSPAPKPPPTSPGVFIGIAIAVVLLGGGAAAYFLFLT